MAHAESLRHVEALLEEILADKGGVNTIKRGLEAFLSAVMESEVTELTGAPHGARDEARVGHRNGYRDRKFQTGLGSHELRIPKLRRGTDLPSFLKSRQRSDDALMLAVAACYHQGASTRNVEKVAQALGVESLKKSTVSSIVSRMDPQIEAFRKRGLGAHPYVFLDARYENVREDHAVRKVAVLVALGVRRTGRARSSATAWPGSRTKRTGEPSSATWFSVGCLGSGWSSATLTKAYDGRSRRACQPPGGRGARSTSFATWVPECRASSDQRSWPPRRPCSRSTPSGAERQRSEVAELFRKAGREDAAAFLDGTDEVLTYLDFPVEHHTKLHSTNMVERLNRELKRRTRVVSIFPNRASLARLVGALLLEEHEEWIVARRYISERSMKKLLTPQQLLEEELPGAGGLLVAK